MRWELDYEEGVAPASGQKREGEDTEDTLPSALWQCQISSPWQQQEELVGERYCSIVVPTAWELVHAFPQESHRFLRLSGTRTSKSSFLRVQHSLLPIVLGGLECLMPN